MGKSRAVRLSDEEEQLIQDFLSLNPALDFSTLIRMALRQFVRDPQLAIRPLHLDVTRSPRTNRKNMEA